MCPGRKYTLYCIVEQNRFIAQYFCCRKRFPSKNVHLKKRAFRDSINDILTIQQFVDDHKTQHNHYELGCINNQFPKALFHGQLTWRVRNTTSTIQITNPMPYEGRTMFILSIKLGFHCLDSNQEIHRM